MVPFRILPKTLRQRANTKDDLGRRSVPVDQSWIRHTSAGWTRAVLYSGRQFIGIPESRGQSFGLCAIRFQCFGLEAKEVIAL